MKEININLAASRSLLLFESAARLGSFSRAAQDMKVSQPAVSHGVRRLEEVLGTRLFIRRARGVELTEAGARLAARLRSGYAEIDAGIREVMAIGSAHQRVTLMVSTSLASYWLMPRLPRFKQMYPGIDLRCITQDTDRDVRAGDYDLCIPLGHGSWPGFQTWKFADEEISPVCSPGYFQRVGSLDGPADLLSLDLLVLEERYPSRIDWQGWFRRVGVDAPRRIEGAASNDYSLVLQAAVSGQGVALGWRHIVQPLLDEGVLVRVVDARVRTEHPFHIVAPGSAALRPEVAALRDWLIAQIGAPPAGTTAEGAGLQRPR